MTTSTSTDAIDWQECLNLANQKPDIAKDLLTMFVQDIPNTRQHLQAAFDATNYDELQAQAHRLHGASCYCGVPRTKAAARELEIYLASASTAALDAHHIAALFETLLDQLTAVEQHFEQLSLE